MEDSYDRQKVIDCMFDPITSTLIEELENGEKDLQYLSQKQSISESKVTDSLSYLLKCGFIFKKESNGKTIFSANFEKFSKVVEDEENFGAAIEGLEKMDSFLN